MVEYKCFRCGYIAKQKSNLVNHLKRKNICLPKNDDVSIYWNKIYEPDVIAKGKKIRDIFIKNEIEFKYFKGNILNEFQEVTKNDGTRFKVFTPFWRNAEQKFLGLPPTKNYIIKKSKLIRIDDN